MKTFSFADRAASIQNLRDRVFDLVIIGGGINGAGIARDAILRGMSVALVEAGDFASGTSSRSSKLIHGGIRYLENLEFHLVFEALNERTRLFRMAPHLVHPLRFMIPLYRGGRVGMFKMGLGMWAYDALSLFEAPEIHERLDPSKAVGRQPLLKSADLLGAFVYSDAYMDDDRLVFETLRSANQGEFSAANYVRATGAVMRDGRVTAVKCVDAGTGAGFEIRGRHFVSTVGPWTDDLGSRFFEGWNQVLRPTKGVHLTFEKKRFPLSSAVVMAAEKRIVFAIPRHEMVIVGTTDTDFSGDPARVTATPEDVRYLLDVVATYFPGAALGARDIVATYAGVRPLVRDDAESEGKTSREHSIWSGPGGVTFVAGGKYTTYRLISEQAVDRVLKSFSIEDRVKFRRGPSADPLNPLVTEESFAANEDRIRRLRSITRMSELECRWLAERHGAEAEKFLLLYGHEPTYWQFEALHAIDQTMCLHLKDFFTRRVPLMLAFRDHGISLLDQIIPVFQSKLGWSSEQTENEKKALLETIEQEMAWKKSL